MKYLFIILLALTSCQKDCIEPQVVGVIEMTPNPDDSDRLIFNIQAPERNDFHPVQPSLLSAILDKNKLY